MKKIFNKNEFCFMAKIFAIAILFTIIPPFIIYMVSNDIIFDKIKFIHKWIELFGGGIIIALLLFVITNKFTYEQNKNSDKAKKEQIKYNLNTIINILQTKSESEKSIGLVYLDSTLQLTISISDDISKSNLLGQFNSNYVEIKKELDNLNEINETPNTIINKINEIIKQLYL
ncbi:MAG: hypothetical protein LBN27_08250 [Prevotellaceae bacterium]|nr:hypothetical protein [Prevotellaceae bacterium]